MMRELSFRQKGSSLIVSLIMLVLLALIVTSAFNVSGGNLRSVGNMQWRDESVAAANQVLEQMVSTTFYNATTNQTFNVDINKDGTDDYSVVFAPPTCIRAVQTAEASPSDVELSSDLSSGSWWTTEWDIKATVTDATTGASVVVRQGVRVKMNDADKSSKC